MKILTDSEAVKALTYNEFGIGETPSQKLLPIAHGILSLETPLEAWNRYVCQCLDELLMALDKL